MERLWFPVLAKHLSIFVITGILIGFLPQCLHGLKCYSCEYYFLDTPTRKGGTPACIDPDKDKPSKELCVSDEVCEKVTTAPADDQHKYEDAWKMITRGCGTPPKDHPEKNGCHVRKVNERSGGAAKVMNGSNFIKTFEKIRPQIKPEQEGKDGEEIDVIRNIKVCYCDTADLCNNEVAENGSSNPNQNIGFEMFQKIIVFFLATLLPRHFFVCTM